MITSYIFLCVSTVAYSGAILFKVSAENVSLPRRIQLFASAMEVWLLFLCANDYVSDAIFSSHSAFNESIRLPKINCETMRLGAFLVFANNKLNEMQMNQLMSVTENPYHSHFSGSVGHKPVFVNLIYIFTPQNTHTHYRHICTFVYRKGS